MCKAGHRWTSSVLHTRKVKRVQVELAPGQAGHTKCAHVLRMAKPPYYSIRVNTGLPSETIAVQSKNWVSLVLVASHQLLHLLRHVSQGLRDHGFSGTRIGLLPLLLLLLTGRWGSGNCIVDDSGVQIPEQHNIRQKTFEWMVWVDKRFGSIGADSPE